MAAYRRVDDLYTAISSGPNARYEYEKPVSFYRALGKAHNPPGHTEIYTVSLRASCKSVCVTKVG